MKFYSMAGALAALASLAMLGGAQAAHAAPLVTASIGLFGPKGYVASYEKQGDAIHIRICKKDTVKNEIESASGRELAPGTSEVVMSERDFRALVHMGLAKIDKSVLSANQKALLERELTDLPIQTRSRRPHRATCAEPAALFGRSYPKRRVGNPFITT